MSELAMRAPKWRALLDETDLQVGEMKSVLAGRHDVLLVRLEDGVRAYGNLCPHKMCPLHEGKLENRVLTCTAHRWTFDASTGKAINPRGSELRVYPVRIMDARIEADLG